MSVLGQLKTNRCKFTWSLKDFSKLGKNVNDQIKSPFFNIKDLHCRLLLNPYGEPKSLPGFVAIFLQLHSHREIEIYFELMMSDVTGAELTRFSNKIYQFTSEKNNWGWRNFIKRDLLVQKKDNLLDDTLNITCTIHMDIYKKEEVNIDRKILNNYESLFFNENFSDLTIAIKNNKLKVHKSILSARSKVFEAMFRHDMKENKTNIKITDVTYNVMRELLLFIYAGRVNNLKKNAKALLPAAEKYGIEELKVLCEKSISKNIKIEDASEILIFADLYNCSKLKAQVIDYIIAHVKEINKTPGFKKLIRSKPELFEEFFAEVVKKKC